MTWLALSLSPWREGHGGSTSTSANHPPRIVTGAEAYGKGGKGGRGLHPCTSQLNLSALLIHPKHTLNTP